MTRASTVNDAPNREGYPMAKRIALFGTLILSLGLLPGCPSAGSALVGTWIFTIGGSDLGIQINRHVLLESRWDARDV